MRNQIKLRHIARSCVTEEGLNACLSLVEAPLDYLLQLSMCLLSHENSHYGSLCTTRPPAILRSKITDSTSELKKIKNTFLKPSQGSNCSALSFVLWHQQSQPCKSHNFSDFPQWRACHNSHPSVLAEKP